MDPAAGGRIHPNDLRRIVRALEVHQITGTPISVLQTQWTREHPAMDAVFIGIQREKDLLSRRINARVKQMVEMGLVGEDELARLLNEKLGVPYLDREALEAIPEDQMDDVVTAMPQPLRNQLLPVVNTELRRKMLLANNPQAVVNYDLNEAKFYRAIYSNRQLEEQLTDFWYNHFNVFLDKGADRILVPTYEREAIRPHILGKFRDLLEATAKSPAMLFYLDNWESVGPVPPQLPAKATSRGG